MLGPRSTSLQLVTPLISRRPVLFVRASRMPRWLAPAAAPRPSLRSILPLDAICTRAQTDVVSLIKDDKDVVKYGEAGSRRNESSVLSSVPTPCIAAH